VTLGDVSERRGDPDDRRAVLRECVEAALGRFAGRSTITVDELAEIMHCARSTAYEAVRRGDIPALHLGERRVVVPVPALVALLIGVDTNGVNATETGPAEPVPVLADHHGGTRGESVSP
jgi:excisionase family DNA binding protein